MAVGFSNCHSEKSITQKDIDILLFLVLLANQLYNSQSTNAKISPEEKKTKKKHALIIRNNICLNGENNIRCKLNQIIIAMHANKRVFSNTAHIWSSTIAHLWLQFVKGILSKKGLATNSEIYNRWSYEF